MVNSEAGKTKNIPGSEKYNQTLTARMFKILRIAEDLFGERDSSYTPLGVNICDVDHPKTWYPPGNCKNIVIILMAIVLNDEQQALYQLAHETVHLLSPTGGNHARNFEEGVATWFSNYYLCQKCFEGMSPSDESYHRPLAIVKPFLDKDPCLVKRIRKKQPSFHKMIVEDIRREFKDMKEEDLEFLVANFQRSPTTPTT